MRKCNILSNRLWGICEAVTNLSYSTVDTVKGRCWNYLIASNITANLIPTGLPRQAVFGSNWKSKEWQKDNTYTHSSFSKKKGYSVCCMSTEFWFRHCMCQLLLAGEAWWMQRTHLLRFLCLLRESGDSHTHPFYILSSLIWFDSIYEFIYSFFRFSLVLW